MVEDDIEQIAAKRDRRLSEANPQTVQEVTRPSPRQFIQQEERERGSVKLAIYLAYIKASGG